MGFLQINKFYDESNVWDSFWNHSEKIFLMQLEARATRETSHFTATFFKEAFSSICNWICFLLQCRFPRRSFYARMEMKENSEEWGVGAIGGFYLNLLTFSKSFHRELAKLFHAYSKATRNPARKFSAVISRKFGENGIRKFYK